jgi:hypothetical protein
MKLINISNLLFSEKFQCESGATGILDFNHTNKATFKVTFTKKFAATPTILVAPKELQPVGSFELPMFNITTIGLTKLGFTIIDQKLGTPGEIALTSLNVAWIACGKA